MWSRTKRCVLLQNRLLEIAELGARLQPQLVAHDSAEDAVRLEGVGLPPRAVEGEHELCAEPLVERMEAHERLELADGVGLASQREHRFEAGFERLQAEAFEAGDLGLREGLVREVRERWATPERERLRELRLCVRGCARAERSSPVGEQSLELVGVEGSGGYAKQIPGWLGRERDVSIRIVVLEKSAELRHVDLDAVRRRRRRCVAPERVDEAIARHDAIALEEKQREQATLLGSAEGEHTATDDHLHRSEDPELDHRSPPSTTAQP